MYGIVTCIWLIVFWMCLVNVGCFNDGQSSALSSKNLACLLTTLFLGTRYGNEFCVVSNHQTFQHIISVVFERPQQEVWGGSKYLNFGKEDHLPLR